MATLRNEGKYVLAARAGGTALAAFTQLAISNSTAAESATSTSFTGEYATAGLAPAVATFTYSTAYVAQWTYTWTSTETTTIHKVAVKSTASYYLMEHLFVVDKGIISGETFTGTVQMLVSST